MADGAAGLPILASAPKLQRLCDVVYPYGIYFRQVGDGAGHASHAVEPARAQPKSFRCGPQQS